MLAINNVSAAKTQARTRVPVKLTHEAGADLVALWRKGDTLLYGKRRESLALRSKDAALAFSLSRTRLRVGWVLRPMPWLNPRPSLGGVSREPPEVEALSWFSEEERGECPFCGERAVVGPAGARICLACDTPVHSAADEEE